VQERHNEATERTAIEFANTPYFPQNTIMVGKKKALDILGDLKEKIPLLSKISPTGRLDYSTWAYNFETAITKIFPNNNSYLDKFRKFQFVFKGIGQPDDKCGGVAFGLEDAGALLDAMRHEVETYWSENGTSMYPLGQQTVASSDPEQARDPQAVFVVHGRNEAIRKAMFSFLRAIGLKPMEWSKARAATKDPNPYVGDILRTAFSDAQAFVVVMTPDDEGHLKAEFRNENEPVHETNLTGQPRQNVLFESGMAMGYDSKRTVLIEIGLLRPFTDIVGRHTVRLDNSPEKRKELAQRLKTAGCSVDLDGDEWLTVGSFEVQDSKQLDNVKRPSKVRTQKLNLKSESIQGSNEPLEQDARNILSYIFHNAPCDVGEIKKHVFDDKIHRGVVQHHCNELMGRKLIEISVDTEASETPEYIITPEGIKSVHSPDG
jgi:predicted nucleotide-binding protein